MQFGLYECSLWDYCRCWIMIKTACECHVAVWILHSLMVWSPVLSSQMRLLIWAPLTKKTHRVNLKKPSLSCLLCCCYPTFFKNRCLLHLYLPPLCSWYFQPPLWVLWDFYCSVKSAAALMARPSRAVIQTSKLLGHKSCPEFALAGSSSRGRGRDYLFIWNLSGHGCLLSSGDYKIQTFNLCGTHWGWHERGSEDCMLFISRGSWGWIMEVYWWQNNLVSEMPMLKLESVQVGSDLTCRCHLLRLCPLCNTRLFSTVLHQLKSSKFLFILPKITNHIASVSFTICAVSAF